MYTRILVPIDGSEHAKQALAVACQLLNENASTLYLLHVPEALTYTTTLVWSIGTIDVEASRAQREKAGEQLLRQAAMSAREQGALKIEELVIQGDPSQVILEAASTYGAHTIVMGSRGLSDLGSIVIGSVSHKVSHSAECSVITVRS